MGLLQLVLRPGVQSVTIPYRLEATQFTLKNVEYHFNVANHGFYQARIGMNFLPQNNVNNNLNFDRSIITGIDHTAPFSNSVYDMNLGVFQIPRAFVVNVDLDSGFQIVKVTDTVAGGVNGFVPANNPNVTYDYVQGGTASTWVSIGTGADYILNNPTTVNTTTGKLNGPIPFMYCLVLNLVYDENNF